MSTSVKRTSAYDVYGWNGYGIALWCRAYRGNDRDLPQDLSVGMHAQGRHEGERPRCLSMMAQFHCDNAFS